MASYHVSFKTISRSAGRSVVAAAAYRSGTKLVDDETGQRFDYTKKSGVLSSKIYLPDQVDLSMLDRNKLWDAATKSETRKNSTLGREIEIALPAELDFNQRSVLLEKISLELVKEHGCALDVAMHLPHRRYSNDSYEDNSLEAKHDSKRPNYHAHILMTTRRLGKDGFGEKCRELDNRKSGKVEFWRERIATLTNEALAEAGFDSRVSHLSLEDQGIDRDPVVRLPKAVMELERRGEITEFGAVIRDRHAAKCAEKTLKKETEVLRVVDRDIASWLSDLATLEEQAELRVREQEAEEKAVLASMLGRNAAVRPVPVAGVPRVQHLKRSDLELAREAEVKRLAGLHESQVRIHKELEKAQPRAVIDKAKGDLIVIAGAIEANSRGRVELDKQLIKLNGKFFGLYSKLPAWLTPEKTDLKSKISKGKDTGSKLQDKADKTKKVAEAQEKEKLKKEADELEEKKRRAKAKADDLASDIALQPPSSDKPSPPPGQRHSRVVASPGRSAGMSMGMAGPGGGAGGSAGGGGGGGGK